MRQLVVHHRYGLGLPWDVSGFHNHGVAKAVTPNAGAMRFTPPSSRIEVPPSSTLGDLRAFRCTVTFRLQGPTTSVERYNLAEGFLSFALFIDKGYRLTASILDGSGSWSSVNGPSHPLGMPFTAGQWQRADCGHDGASTLWLALDGKVIAQRSDVPGPVRGVGQLGLTVGAWPDKEAYAFSGDIGEVWLWRERPEDPFDDCCVDRDALCVAGAAVRRLGYDRAALVEVQTQLHTLVAELFTALPDTAREDVARTGARMVGAFRGGRYKTFDQLLEHTRHVLETALGGPKLESTATQFAELLAPLHEDPELRAALRGFLCGERPGPTRRPTRPAPAPEPGGPWPGDPFGEDPAGGGHPGYPPATKIESAAPARRGDGEAAS